MVSVERVVEYTSLPPEDPSFDPSVNTNISKQKTRKTWFSQMTFNTKKQSREYLHRDQVYEHLSQRDDEDLERGWDGLLTPFVVADDSTRRYASFLRCL
jgi:hypothetical protein